MELQVFFASRCHRTCSSWYQSEPLYQTNKDILRRLTDFWELSALKIQFNLHFDDLLSVRGYDVYLSLPTATSDLEAIALTSLTSAPVNPLAPSEYPDTVAYLSAYNFLVPSATQPPVIKLISLNMFSTEVPPLSNEELTRFMTSA